MFAMYDLCHPSYYKISQLGCSDGIKITTAFYIYIELCEVKRLWDVEYKYNNEIDIIYLKGKKHKSSSPEIFIPWPSIYKISLEQIESIQKHLEINRVTFVFRGGDGTTVYYKVTAALVKPVSHEETEQIKKKDENKFELEQEIRRNTSILYELAKSLESTQSKNTKPENTASTNEEEKSNPETNEKVQEAPEEKVEDDQGTQGTESKKSPDSNVPIITSVEIISEPKIKIPDIEMLDIS